MELKMSCKNEKKNGTKRGGMIGANCNANDFLFASQALEESVLKSPIEAGSPVANTRCPTIRALPY